MRHIITCILLIVTKCTAIACDCGPGVFSVQDYNEMSVIFIGKYVGFEEDRKLSSFAKINEFEVVKWYKGNNGSGKIFIRDAWGSSSCGIGKLTPGMEYLVYAHQVVYVESKDTMLVTSMCDRTTFVPVTTKNHALASDSIIFMWYPHHISDSTHFVTDTIQLNSIIKKIARGGPHKFFYPNKNLMADGVYENGVQVGMWKYYNYDGRLYEAGVYKNGLRDSIWARYTYTTINDNPNYNNKKVKIDELQEYKEGKPTLWNVSYTGDIPHKFSETYLSEDSSMWVTKNYYHNGKVRNVYTHGPVRYNKLGVMRRGSMQGEFKEFFENGKIKEQGVYYKNIEIGEWKEYDENGKVIAIRIGKTKEEVDMMSDTE